MSEMLLVVMGLTVGLLLAVVAYLLLRKAGKRAPIEEIRTRTIFERINAVGRLVCLEVCAKEIATSRRGWSWLPPIILSPAKLAMIFHFEKQYSIDLTSVRPSDVQKIDEKKYRVNLPAIEGVLRLRDVEPYDIQAGRVLGLLDIIQMDAPAQQDLMSRAQAQASDLYSSNDKKYDAEAKRSVERQLGALLSLFEIEVEFVWPETARIDVDQISSSVA